MNYDLMNDLDKQQKFLNNKQNVSPSAQPISEGEEYIQSDSPQINVKDEPLKYLTGRQSCLID
jgi:hypothetical protein